MRRYCSSRTELEIRAVDDFFQNIVGVHHVMVAGIYTKELREEMMRLNVDVIGPGDSTVPVLKGRTLTGTYIAFRADNPFL